MTRIGLVLAVTAAAALAGCVSGAPAADFSQPFPEGVWIGSDDRVEVSVTEAEGLELEPDVLARLDRRIRRWIEDRRAAAVPSDDGTQTYAVLVVLTDYYDSPGVRLLTAGTGSIHIDATVTVTTGGEQVAVFEIAKGTVVIAFGMIYGALNRVHALEMPFAEGIAIAVVPNVPGLEE